MDLSFWLKMIVTVLTFALAAIEFGFLIKIKKQTLKKRWIGILFVSLILFTVWDTTKESYDNSEAETKRDSLITVDSLRAAQILTNLEINLDSLSGTRKEIMAVDSLLGNVRDTLQNQVALLSQAVQKSKELNDLETQRFALGRPNLLVQDVKLSKSTIDSTKHDIVCLVYNYGKRKATEIEYETILVSYNRKTSQKNIYFSNDLSNIKRMNHLVGEAKIPRRLIIMFQVNKSEIIDVYGGLMFIVNLKYLDAATGKVEVDNHFFTARHIGIGDETFFDAHPREIKILSDYLRSLKVDFPL